MAKIVNIDKDVRSLAERAYDEIKKRIFDFVLMPGDRLSESDLAQQTQVSRTPLRQALSACSTKVLSKRFPRWAG